jgi:type VI secretion system protein VasJ
MDLLLLGKEPVSADNPAGSDIRYDPEFEELQAEIDKLSSPTTIETMDWGKVARLSSEILAQKSKDLRVASYLSIALIYTQQIEGFAGGLRVYLDLLEQFWENLFPLKARMRGRVMALEWWLEKTETALNQMKKTSIAREQINLIRDTAEKIDQFLQHNIEEHLSLSPVYEFLNSLDALSEEQPGEKVHAQASPEAAKQGVPVSATEVKEEGLIEAISTPREAEQVLNFAVRKMSDVATYFWQQDISNPMLYRLDRITAWMTVGELPPSTDTQTRIPPPAAQVKNILDDLKNRGDHESLLKVVEEKLSQFIFWIDLNRLAAEALSALGDKYERANQAVCQETALFIHRLPGLEELAFSDGTPFADHETRQWLKMISLSATSEPSESAAITESDVSSEGVMIQQEMKEAQALIRKKKLIEAIDRIQQKIHQSFSRKEKLLWRLALSQLFINNNKPQFLIPHLEQIMTDIDMFKLEEYDPLFALKCLKLVWQGFHLQSDQTSKDKAGETLQRIARIDMAEMIRLGKG